MGTSTKNRARAKPAAAQPIKWIDEQIAVITAPANARLLVSAGPGTGKTAVTCARIARLIGELDIEPSKIWLVSFTRTAVHELRQRVSAFLEDGVKTAGIRIATLDSHAWAIHSGFDSEASLTGSYEENIHNVIGLIKKHEGVADYLSGVRHVFIDEAQDVIGIRCELVLELIYAFPQECGVTVLADEAQSIYGFSEEESIGQVHGTLPEKIREFLRFKELHLKEIHRTDDPTLIDLFGKGRGIILKGTLRGKARLEKIREFIGKTNHGNAGQYRDDIKAIPEGLDDAFLLFRKRGEALEASSYLAAKPHRLRMSGLPSAIRPWIGVILWDWTSVELGLGEFQRRWTTRVGADKPACDVAWRSLVRICGLTEQTISTQKLASRLGGGSPPIELSDVDFGSGGPVVGTIHAAKGREASEVRLYLPPPRDKIKDEAAEEEARVLFVGATRAKNRLHIGKGQTKVFARKAESGRAFTPYTFKGDARACFEIGRREDIEPAGLAGRAFFEREADVAAAQERIKALAGRITTEVSATVDPSRSWRYRVQKDGQLLCYLSKRVNDDLFEVAREVDGIVHRRRMKPPTEIKYLRIFGARTVALPPDDAARESLHAPWRDSGFVLAPLVIGYSLAWFR